MCGIAGCYNFKKKQINKTVISSMISSLIHRGPDAFGIELIGHVGLGHRRLSIIDLSNSGAQPMNSLSNRFSISYNGEVYNFQDIKSDLISKGYKFISNSDTEVILTCYEEYGLNSFSMLNGMFAIAIYDSLEDELILARDSFGIKPLYFYQNQDSFYFSSEIKALRKVNGINLSISKQAFSEYLWYGNPLGNKTMFNEINEIEPGSFKIISSNKNISKKFFSIKKLSDIDISEEAAIKRTHKLLEESIKRHLISDVDIGVFLSGGIDSSAITAFASKHYSKKLKTFSVGFDFSNNHELPLARKIAKKFNTDHTEVIIAGSNIIDVINKLVNSHDQPFADAADIPLYLLSEKLKGKIKVVLQGDGGDEFFGGYSRYFTINSRKKWLLLSWLPNLVSFFRFRSTKILRLQRFISAITERKQYLRNALLLTMESRFSDPLKVLNKTWYNKLKNHDPFKEYQKLYEGYHDKDDAQALFYTDSQLILRNTFFNKVDKSTMANSLEVRVPFIDKKLTEFILSVPSKIKLRYNRPKFLLKKALKNILPKEVLYGKKKGFGVPYDYWLKTSLSDYFLRLINSKKSSIFFDKEYILKIFNEHKMNKGNHGFILWKVFIFAIWINKKENKKFICV
tara:strand:+ start:1541 stop:3418 length:1878 start_codon:yes stop_codon:yes gene_type:complete